MGPRVSMTSALSDLTCPALRQDMTQPSRSATHASLMKHSFLCCPSVRKISVASYMCCFVMILLTLYATSGALRRSAVNCSVMRKNVVNAACAIISGRTNCEQERAGREGKE